jgi:thymidylate synthase
VWRFDRAAPGSYLYAELLFAFPRPAEVDSAVAVLHESAGYEAAVAYLRGNARVPAERVDDLVARVGASDLAPAERLAVLLEGLIPPTDQVANIVERIQRKPDDLDKECILWDPRYHSTLESGRPCLMKLSFSVRAGKLDVLAFFRSHDIFGAWFYNYYGIASLLKRIADASGVVPGRIVVESESAHIYPRHWSTVERLLKAELEEKPARMYFDAELDSDPRGNTSITLVDGKINLRLMTPAGDAVVLELAARTERELLYRLRHLDPFSRLDHAAFVGGEVARAEVALRLGIPYEQDKGLALGPAGDS